jgi:hypothetical protein
MASVVALYEAEFVGRFIALLEEEEEEEELLAGDDELWEGAEVFS